MNDQNLDHFRPLRDTFGYEAKLAEMRARCAARNRTLALEQALAATARAADGPAAFLVDVLNMVHDAAYVAGFEGDAREVLGAWGILETCQRRARRYRDEGVLEPEDDLTDELDA
jgi:hypothetical protein